MVGITLDLYSHVTRSIDGRRRTLLPERFLNGWQTADDNPPLSAAPTSRSDDYVTSVHEQQRRGL